MKKRALRLLHCRLCKSKDLKPVLDLGTTALANSFLKHKDLSKKEFTFPLALRFCQNCGNLQTSHVVPPALMFRDYIWVSSTSPVTVAHFENYATTTFKKLKMKRGNFVVEMGSNDGVLLKPFKKLGARILGVDPAKNVAARATKDGVPTLPNFFSYEIAKKIKGKYGKANVITGNNVFAHINNLDEIVRGVKELLDEDGVFIIEFPYLGDFLKKNLFDLVYHEHLSYLSINPLDSFFGRHNMQIFDVVKTPVHGGSTRLFIQKSGGPHQRDRSVNRFIKLEQEMKLDKFQTYKKFEKEVEKNKKILMRVLIELKRKNKKIVGFGAAAKSNTLLSYYGIDNQILDYIVDDSPYKQGVFTPGTHIPVVEPTIIDKVKPDYILILAWNFAEPIMQKGSVSTFKKDEGHFIIPVPKPCII